MGVKNWEGKEVTWENWRFGDGPRPPKPGGDPVGDWFDAGNPPCRDCGRLWPNKNAGRCPACHKLFAGRLTTAVWHPEKLAEPEKKPTFQPPAAYREAFSSTLTIPVREAIQGWLSGATHPFILLHGPTQAGKSWAAFATARDIQYPNFYSVPELFLLLRREAQKSHSTFVENLASTKSVLFLDDIGVEKPSAFVVESLYLILNGRANEELRTFITTNVSREEMTKTLGERISSRVFCGVTVEM